MIITRNMKRMHSLGFASKGPPDDQILYEIHEMNFQSHSISRVPNPMRAIKYIKDNYTSNKNQYLPLPRS
jgi:hypothetical protein